MIKNLLLKALVKGLNLWIAKHKSKHRFLIVTTTALGDTLWATPAIESLRKSFPDSYIGVLTSKIGEQILRHNPHINQIFLLERSLLLVKRLYDQNFDTVLVFHTSQRIVLPLISCLGATQIIGTEGINKGLDDLFTKTLSKKHEHEIVRRLRVVEAVGAKATTQTLSFYLNQEELLPSKASYWIALHPGSKDGFKRWPFFAELGKKIKEKIPCEILITGTKEERPLMEEIAAQIPGAVLDDPNGSLRSFAARLNQTHLIVTNDTGPLHLACALKRPVLGIYCSTDPLLCGPHLAKEALAIAKRPTCTPCLKRKCLEPFCFQQIGIDEVFEVVQKHYYNKL
jgi:ADP-heptose:LPS heptosyltransferase